MLRIFDLEGAPFCEFGSRCTDTECRLVYRRRLPPPDTDQEEDPGIVTGLPTAVALHDGVGIVHSPRYIEGDSAKRLEGAFTEVWAAGASAAVLVVRCQGGNTQVGAALLGVVRRQPHPVVAFVEAAHSGGFLLAVAPDRVVVAPDGELGGLGAMARVCDRRRIVTAFEPFEKLASLENHPPVVGEIPDLAGLEESVWNTRSWMIAYVWNRRKLPLDVAWDLSSRKHWHIPAEQALDLGLADRLGTLPDALAEARRLAANR